jgi:hypothetical protein
MAWLRPIQPDLAIPTHASSPGELTVAGTQDFGGDGLAGRTQVAGFRLQTALVAG